MPYNRNNYRVNVPRRSGFDKSHRNSGTLTSGTLTPILCDELIPNSRVSLRLPISAMMPPLVSDTYMNAKLKCEAFFVPSRLLCASFEKFFCDTPAQVANFTPAGDNASFVPVDAIAAVPSVLFVNADNHYLSAGSLADFLGIRAQIASNGSYTFNLMPFLAYHLVWEEWYRNPRVQRPAFMRYTNRNPTGAAPVFAAPFTFYTSQSDAIGNADNFFSISVYDSPSTDSESLENLRLADGKMIFELRQRNFGLDLFTGARLDAQQGNASRVEIDAPQDGALGFSIASLRAANSLQLFRERNNIASDRFTDQNRARYGANLSDGVAQRPICIGSASYDINSRGIDQTAGGSSSTAENDNPFSATAAQYGRAFAAGNDFLIKDFTANEPGYLLVLVSLVPEVTYGTGVDPMFTRYTRDGSIVEMANPLLQNTGDQPIMKDMLSLNVGFSVPNPEARIFGYQDRYFDFMFKPNAAHGLFRDGENLSSFVLTRSFDGNLLSSVALSSAFLEIPKGYFDEVMQVSEKTSGLSAWYDAYLDYKVSMPLAEFSIPSLQDPAYEHGESIILRRNGQLL